MIEGLLPDMGRSRAVMKPKPNSYVPFGSANKWQKNNVPREMFRTPAQYVYDTCVGELFSSARKLGGGQNF